MEKSFQGYTKLYIYTIHNFMCVCIYMHIFFHMPAELLWYSFAILACIRTYQLIICGVIFILLFAVHVHG